MMASSSSSSEEQKPEPQQPQQHQNSESQSQQQQAPAVKEKECVHKTKTIQFLGRTTPIVLQNDNGPCPLIAICNVLLLRNNVNLNPDMTEVSQEKLLSLIAERLLDSNSSVDNKDAGYLENQAQNISDVIELLPRLRTGIDVNIKFKRIGDFEFTPECAIFDLLDIPLYHGWIVDPQDETANAIGSKSYNVLMSELVALETRNMEGECKSHPEEDCIDFAAATTATLGVPSPCLSKTRSFDDSPRAGSDHKVMRKGDLEEEEELNRIMKLSEVEALPSQDNTLVGNADGAIISTSSDKSKEVMPVDSGNKMHVQNQALHQPEASVPDNCNASSSDNNDRTSFTTITGEAASSCLKTEEGNHLDPSACAETIMPVICNDVEEKSHIGTQQPTKSAASLSLVNDTASVDENHKDISQGTDKISESIIAPDVDKSVGHQNGCVKTELSCLSGPAADSDSSSGRILHTGVPESLTSSVDGSEPMYEGEECILDSGPKNNENREPMYEGEVILAEQADNSIVDACDVRSKDEITTEQGNAIRSFLKNNASQLTFTGLFCLQEGLKERELCVFFRNNHFSTMFKYEKQLYLLATDQGYMDEPNLVWEKLNEVNGDTIFMAGNFTEFKAESHTPETWGENKAAEYLASVDSVSQAGREMTPDEQLALALHYQDLEEQQPVRQNLQQPSVSGGSRLVTGPQVARNTNRTSTASSSRPEPKSKDKCTVM